VPFEAGVPWSPPAHSAAQSPLAEPSQRNPNAVEHPDVGLHSQTARTFWSTAPPAGSRIGLALCEGRAARDGAVAKPNPRCHYWRWEAILGKVWTEAAGDGLDRSSG
jgi:hypothetical protein